MFRTTYRIICSSTCLSKEGLDMRYLCCPHFTHVDNGGPKGSSDVLRAIPLTVGYGAAQNHSMSNSVFFDVPACALQQLSWQLRDRDFNVVNSAANVFFTLTISWPKATKKRRGIEFVLFWFGPEDSPKDARRGRRGGAGRGWNRRRKRSKASKKNEEGSNSCFPDLGQETAPKMDRIRASLIWIRRRPRRTPGGVPSVSEAAEIVADSNSCFPDLEQETALKDARVPEEAPEAAEIVAENNRKGTEFVLSWFGPGDGPERRPAGSSRASESAKNRRRKRLKAWKKKRRGIEFVLPWFGERPKRLKSSPKINERVKKTNRGRICASLIWTRRRPQGTPGEVPNRRRKRPKASEKRTGVGFVLPWFGSGDGPETRPAGPWERRRTMKASRILRANVESLARVIFRLVAGEAAAKMLIC